ncbi:MAG: hypothetical protein HC919_08030 [Oscillatoriales cyanobacterium SM2_2_1]|nr:hypothetical protein [Oscillatoriales cyanobacterium SM2_2_1]
MNELRMVLDVASDEELHQIADILFRRAFNPLDYFATPSVTEILSWQRHDLIEHLLKRFSFLAADGWLVLKRRTGTLTYRDILVRVTQFLKLPVSHALTVPQMEAEIFLHLMQQAWNKLSPQERDAPQSTIRAQELHHTLPAEWSNQPWRVLLGGSAAAVSIAQPAVMHLLARQVAWQLARLQIGEELLKAGGGAIAKKIQAQFAVNLAQRGVSQALARQAAARTVFAVITPALWGLFLADLGWRAIATNYGRVIPVIFTVAQIRLLRP